MKKYLSLLFILTAVLTARAEDGSKLWLRMERQQVAAEVKTDSRTATAAIAVKELENYWRGGTVALLTDRNMPEDGSFRISAENGAFTICSATDTGLLYGAYELLREQAAGTLRQPGSAIGLTPSHFRPVFQLRILNHWDNPDGSIERGYAGRSIWKWEEIDGRNGSMSGRLRERITEYARANASIGINGSVLNNVNAAPKILTTEYLQKVRVIADMLRPYGIKVYLSVNFASPKALGATDTADPLDKKTGKWWQKKAREIYRLIPDFGGFLVKANSEGQPGPGDYGRTHAEGANMLAEALKPYNGIIIWRSFVYGANHKDEDRVKQAVSEFEPCDGKFAGNVILQSKNGPLDFQPREPYAPIFDRIKKTQQMAELQITQEYTGQGKHLVYLAPMWKEFFYHIAGCPEVASGGCDMRKKACDGGGHKCQLSGLSDKLKGIAGVANIGDDANWCGHHFSQANWYAFGRLAWNPGLSSEEIAREWLIQTFTTDTVFVNAMAEVMESSREACVDYMMPLGLHHIFKGDHHYGPEPDGNQPHFPMEWRPVYYHKADSTGIGFNRSSTGTNAVGQYREPYASIYNNVKTCPENLLLWFHHLPWDYRMKDGQTLWQGLCAHYNRGVSEVERYAETWRLMRPYVDRQRFEEVDARLRSQLDNAREWRDTCIKYFESRKEGK